MTKKLTLMRHGEAEAGMGYKGDMKRSLTGSGMGKLHRLNKVLRQSKTQFELLIKSPALRATQTAQLISEGLLIGEETMEPAVYESSVDKLLEIIHFLPDRYERVLLVGHNPSLSSLLAYLTDDFNVILAPGMMVVITLEVPEWKMISKGSGCLDEVLQ